MPRFLMGLVLAWLIVPVAQADNIPWRGWLIEGGDTLKIRVDPGAYDISAKRYLSWPKTQDLARNSCLACGAGKWGALELARASMARLTKDQGYRPLADWVFLLISIEVTSTSGQNRTWRFVEGESVVLTMTDGTVLTSEPPREMPEPSISLARPSGPFADHCRQIKLMLGGRVLYSPAKLAELGKHHAEYRDDPSNAFLIPFKYQNPPRDFLKRIIDVKLRIANRWITLEPTTATSQLVGTR